MLSSLQRPNKMVEKKFEHLPSPLCGPYTQSPLSEHIIPALQARTWSPGHGPTARGWNQAQCIICTHLGGAERPHPARGYKVQFFLKEAQPPPDPALNNHHVSQLAQAASVKPLGL